MWQDFSWCFSRWAFCLKPRPHVLHLNGRSLVWVRKWTCKFDLRFLGNILPQTGQVRISSAMLPSCGQRGLMRHAVLLLLVGGAGVLGKLWGLCIPPLLTTSPRGFNDKSFWNKDQRDQEPRQDALASDQLSIPTWTIQPFRNYRCLFVRQSVSIECI